jgi:hypothetical protein
MIESRSGMARVSAKEPVLLFRPWEFSTSRLFRADFAAGWSHFHALGTSQSVIHPIFRSSRSLSPSSVQHFPVMKLRQSDSTSQSQIALQTALPSQNDHCFRASLKEGVSRRSTAVPPGRFNSTDSTFRSGFLLIKAYSLANGLQAKTSTALPGQLPTSETFGKALKISTSQSNDPKSPLSTLFLPHFACGSARFHRTSQSTKPHLPVTSAALPSCIHGTSRSGFQHFPVLLNIEARCSSS